MVGGAKSVVSVLCRHAYLFTTALFAYAKKQHIHYNFIHKSGPWSLLVLGHACSLHLLLSYTRSQQHVVLRVFVSHAPFQPGRNMGTNLYRQLDLKSN